MKKTSDIAETRKDLSGSLAKVTEIDTAELSVLMLDISNAGASAFTGFEVRAAVGVFGKEIWDTE